MSIVSLKYISFLLFGIIVYYILPQKLKSKWLVVLSLCFLFSASLFGISAILSSSLIAFITAKKMSTEKNKSKRKRIILVAIFLEISILGFLKYCTAFSIFSNVIQINEKSNTIRNWISLYITPIGISYFTLQLISYVLDVYWDRIQAEKSYWKILLFTCYFPQLVQGPISKYSELSSELFKEHIFEWKNIKWLFVNSWGFDSPV